MNADALQAKRVVGSNKDPVDFDAIPSTNNGSETNTLAKSIGVNQAESLVYHEDLVTAANRSMTKASSVGDALKLRRGLQRALTNDCPSQEMQDTNVGFLVERCHFVLHQEGYKCRGKAFNR